MGLSQMAMPKGSCLQANAMLLSPQNCSNKSKSNQNVLRRNLHTSYITIPLQPNNYKVRHLHKHKFCGL